MQAEPETGPAVRRARVANDLLADEIRRRPSRYSGFAHLALQDGRAAADELERCVRDLGFKSALVNGSTHALYLDDPSFEPLWERAADLGTVMSPAVMERAVRGA